MTPRPPYCVRSRGSALIFTLAALLVIALGALFTLRGVLTDAGLTGRFGERAKNVPASDLALQYLVTQIESRPAGQMLEIDAVGQPWYLATPLTAAPGPAYWTACENQPATSQDTCAAVPMPAGVSQTAWVFVEPTGRTDSYACNTRNLDAVYYDLWVHTVDSQGTVATNTEALYKLCVLD